MLITFDTLHQISCLICQIKALSKLDLLVYSVRMGTFCTRRNQLWEGNGLGSPHRAKRSPFLQIPKANSHEQIMIMRDGARINDAIGGEEGQERSSSFRLHLGSLGLSSQLYPRKSCMTSTAWASRSVTHMFVHSSSKLRVGTRPKAPNSRRVEFWERHT